MSAGRHAIHVEVLLLAAGPSKRMGTPKQVLQYGDTSFVRHLAREALGSDADGVTVITGAWAERVRRELVDLPVRVVHNENWEEGMASSLRLGLRSLPRTAGAFIMMLCDQPLISKHSLNRIIDTYRSGTSLIVASTYNGITGVPALYDRSLLPHLKDLTGDQGARDFLRSQSHPTSLLPLPEATIDVDTPDDYASFLRFQSAL